MCFTTFRKAISGFLIFSFLLFCVPSASASNLYKKVSTKPNGIVLPIIMYHEIKPYKAREDVITPYEIESDLKYLKANRYTTITMTDLIDYVNDQKKPPGNSIVLSFDDGHYNNYAYVFPLLKAAPRNCESSSNASPVFHKTAYLC